MVLNSSEFPDLRLQYHLAAAQCTKNLTMRMHMRRFTRLTNGFNREVENHMHVVALRFIYYNFMKVHPTLKVTPAMEAGLAA